MESEYVPRFSLAKSYNCRACANNFNRYAGSAERKTMEAAASAAAVSATNSEPGFRVVTFHAGRGCVQSSGRDHDA